ncbi:TlpA family protein disulfide reductase [Ferrovibrio terrae]|uniref:TlpA family protein disulfide reductase n=1 Tax=Ferrovibrio terrae TaxID=2594003 RepID=A0A516GY61_9PROT|nr:TlpA disulfide reductase family protein [Ferrovibrio terrae]QDO96432.1 TlpA family protein disulfide reductase [Ferrovibrio terrae]
MKRFLTVLAAVCAMAGSAMAADLPRQELPRLGEMQKFSVSAERKPAALAEFLDPNDRPVTLEAFRGKVVLLNLWATWCVPCREEMPALDRLQAKRGSKDFAVVAVAQDRSGRAKVEIFLGQIGARHLASYLDTSMKSGRAWGTIGLPTSILIDRQGREIGRLIGAAEWDQADALRLIDAAIAEK